jgi:CMP-N,N'-diacetyllegionaminic acid synthase
MILAIIPARFGSKGIPRKNIMDLCGKPMIQYSIEAAIGSKYIDEVLISTDDGAVIDIASKMGLECKYRRPDELAQDTTSMFDAVDHALKWFKSERGFLPDSIILLQPTSPLRNQFDVDKSIELFRESPIQSLISVHKLSEHPFECIKKDTNDWKFLAEPPKYVTRRQDFKEDFYFINGAIYLINTSLFLREKLFFIKGQALLYEMPRERGIDIDSMSDLIIARSFKEYNNLNLL